MHKAQIPSRRPAASALALSLIGLTCSLAAIAGNYSLPSSTVDGGGQYSQGTRFAVEGTIGQPDTGPLNSNRFSLAGGFWPEAPAVTDAIFANRFED